MYGVCVGGGFLCKNFFFSAETWDSICVALTGQEDYRKYSSFSHEFHKHWLSSYVSELESLYECPGNFTFDIKRVGKEDAMSANSISLFVFKLFKGSLEVAERLEELSAPP